MKINQSDIRPDVPAPGSGTPGVPGADSTVPGPPGTNGTNGADSTVPGPPGADGAGIATGWVTVADAWSYASAITITVPAGAASLYSPGMRIKLTQTTVKYFIITAVADTLLTVYGGTDYTVANAAISAISYSTVKAPFGFPLDPAKWTVEVTDANVKQKNAPTNGTWYGGATAWETGTNISITVPIGCWRLMYEVLLIAQKATTEVGYYLALSTSNSDGMAVPALVAYCAVYHAGGQTVHRECSVTLAAATPYYLLAGSIASLTTFYIPGSTQPTVIRAVSAYL